MNLLVPINDQLVDLCEDHIVLTPNDRLAKEFRNSYDQYQIGKGLTAWTSPVVRSLNNHLRSIFFYGHDDENQNLSVVDNRAVIHSALLHHSRESAFIDKSSDRSDKSHSQI